MTYVAVVGPGSESADESELAALEQDARTIGRGLAAAGAVVVCGGLGGVMEAVAEGVSEQGGQCVGLLPGRERAEANRSLTLALATGLGEARNWLVVCASDVVIALGGGYGTLSEIALALRAGKHVVGLRTWPLPAQEPLMHVASDAAGAVAAALSLAGD